MKEAAGPGAENTAGARPPPCTQLSAQGKAAVLPKTRADVPNVCIIYVKQTLILMLFLCLSAPARVTFVHQEPTEHEIRARVIR